VFVGPPESELVLNWTPRVLRPGVQLQLDVSFKFSQYACRLALLIDSVFFYCHAGTEVLVIL